VEDGSPAEPAEGPWLPAWFGCIFPALRQKLKQAKTPEERRRLAAELKRIYRETGEALKQEKKNGNMTEMDEDKIMRMTGVLHRKVYGEYNEFEEDGMSLSDDMRVIEKLHAEKAELEQSREEERRLREEERQRTARNILRLGLPVEQVAQCTGLPQETVQALAAQL
jgi:signal transduction histidine kinase